MCKLYWYFRLSLDLFVNYLKFVDPGNGSLRLVVFDDDDGVFSYLIVVSVLIALF